MSAPDAWSLLAPEEQAALGRDAVLFRKKATDSVAKLADALGPEAWARYLDDHPELQALYLTPEERASLAAPEREPVASPRTPLPVLADYLAAVERFLRRYVAFPSEHEPVAVALWIAHTHLVERFETSPILAITSAEMRSGKTRVLDCLELLVPEPFRVVIPSEAVTYTVLSQRPRRTMLLDEADAIFGPRTAERYEGLRAILNSGNRQGTPVLRVKLEGRRREVDSFDVFGPKAIAGIGNLPPTVADRAIPIRMKRRTLDEPIAKFRRRLAEAEARAIACEWSRVTVVTDVTVPDELPDRAADSWEPLLAIADAAGAGWPMRARLAAVELSSEEDSTVSVGMRLLADIRDVFGDEEHLATAELLGRLHDLEDAPWEDWYGSPLSGRGLAKLLSPYRVMPQQRRVRGEKSRGYFRVELEDAFRRYVPESGTSGTSGTPSADEPGPVPDVPDVPVPQTQTVIDFDAPLCDECGRRKRLVVDGSGRYVCTFPHRPVNEGGAR